MAYTCTGFNDRYRGILAYKVDEAAAAAWNNQVYIAVGMQQFGGCFAVGRQQFHDVRVYIEVFQYLVYHADNGTVGAVGITATFQYAGVAALQAEREYIEADVGTCFVDDADNAERHTYSFYLQSVG